MQAHPEKRGRVLFVRVVIYPSEDVREALDYRDPALSCLPIKPDESVLLLALNVTKADVKELPDPAPRFVQEGHQGAFYGRLAAFVEEELQVPIRDDAAVIEAFGLTGDLYVISEVLIHPACVSPDLLIRALESLVPILEPLEEALEAAAIVTLRHRGPFVVRVDPGDDRRYVPDHVLIEVLDSFVRYLPELP